MLTKDLTLPNKEERKKESWKFKQLFPIKGVISTIRKKLNIYEILSTLMILITAVSELSGRTLSIYWYIPIVLVLLEALYLRTFIIDDSNKIKKK